MHRKWDRHYKEKVGKERKEQEVFRKHLALEASSHPLFDVKKEILQVSFGFMSMTCDVIETS